MFSIVFLMCMETAGCKAFAGPVLPTEADCSAEYLKGSVFLKNRYPKAEIVGAKCIDWETGEIIPQGTKINH